MRRGPNQEKEKATSLCFLHVLNYFEHMNILFTVFHVHSLERCDANML